MARPIQPLGTYGVITVRRTKNRYVARTRFREPTGAYRRVSASAPTATTAENKLKAKIAAGLPSKAEGDLNGQTKLTVVADVWLEEIEQRQEHAPQTIEVYRDIVRRIVLPAVGELRLSELTVGILDRFLKAEAARGYSRGRHARVVLAQIIDLAVRHDALARNPVRSTAPLRRSRSEIRSLTLDELTEIRRIVRSHRTDPGVPGPPPDGQLAQLFELMLGTSARLGEALAVRRCDVDLDAGQPLVTITGTIVFVRGQGFLRQPHPKHSRYWRTVTVPSFTADALRERLAATGEMDPERTIFHTKAGTPLSPANVRRLWRSIRDTNADMLPEGMDLATVVPHTLRKTVATTLDAAAGTDLAAELLGHSSTAVTRAHYVQPRKLIDPRTAEILESLRPPEPEDPGEVAARSNRCSTIPRMAGGYGRGSGIPLGERARAGQPTAGASQATVDESSSCPARHCWVSVPADGGPPRPGLLLGWRRAELDGGAWIGQVVYVADLRPGEWATVIEWLSADRLTALPPTSPR